MWQAILSIESAETIHTYVAQYQEYFLGRFSDTGIYGEDIIRQNYINDATTLRNNLYDHILTSMRRELIGHELSDWDIRTTAIFFGKRIIFIEYEEDIVMQMRYIQNIKIVYR